MLSPRFGVSFGGRFLIFDKYIDMSRNENRVQYPFVLNGAESGEGVGMGEGMILVALGCGRLPGILDITARHPFVVFGTMEGKVFAGLTACVVDGTASTLPVYFYETG